MKLAIMQPYFFPYIGYFQLMASVDCFVFYDDAQFMKGSWVNRNRILRDGEPAWWTFPIVHDNYKLPIKQRLYSGHSEQVRSMLGKVEGAYRDAPHYSAVLPLLSEIFHSGSDNVAAFNKDLLQKIAIEFGIQCEFLTSSELQPEGERLYGQDRVIDICRRLEASHYINPIGGLELYDRSSFANVGIDLAFLKAKPTNYAQFDRPHVPFLSIVDVMMFNTREQIRELLGEYSLFGPSR